MSISKEAINKLDTILFSKSLGMRNELIKNGVNFAHYTSAAAAESIFKNKEIWLRNTQCMTDYSEVKHGFDLLTSYYGNDDQPSLLKEAIEEVYEGASKDIELGFNSDSFLLKNGCYIFCLTEHEKKDDQFGKLSMWRGYGKGAAVAIVFNREQITSERYEDSHTFLMPVYYFNDDEVNQYYDQVALNIRSESSFLKELSREDFILYILHFLRLSVLTIKHCGFAEEREWRVIYLPNFYNSEYISRDIVCINQIPQDIFKIPLDAQLSQKNKVISLNKILDKVLIGPSDYDASIWRAMYWRLTEAKVSPLDNRIFYTKIPLRW